MAEDDPACRSLFLRIVLHYLRMLVQMICLNKDEMYLSLEEIRVIPKWKKTQEPLGFTRTELLSTRTSGYPSFRINLTTVKSHRQIQVLILLKRELNIIINNKAVHKSLSYYFHYVVVLSLIIYIIRFTVN